MASDMSHNFFPQLGEDHGFGQHHSAGAPREIGDSLTMASDGQIVATTFW